MKIGEKTRSQIFCVFYQAHGDSIKQKHVRLEVNDWRVGKNKSNLNCAYFGLVMQQLESEGLVECVRATKMPYWDDGKVWRWLK